MDPEELDLLAGSLGKAMTSAVPGASLYAALGDLGWQDLLAELPDVAIPLVFRLLGETGAHAPVLPDVVGGPYLPYAGGSWVVWHRDDVPVTAMELPIQRVPAPGSLSPQALAAGRVAAGWWLLGTGRAMLALARQHAVDRVQFGRPIAAFQAVRHKLADTLVALEGAEATLAAASGSGSGSGSGDDLSCLLAKAAAGQAALLAARHCQQVMGGIGFTAEHALHHHVKRALVLDGLLGSTRELTREAGRRVIAGGTAPRIVDLLPPAPPSRPPPSRPPPSRPSRKDTPMTDSTVTYESGAGGLRFEREGSIGWLYIDRPHARNAFTPAMYWGIKKAVHLVNSDPDFAALIITGTGDVFAPGGDLGGRADPGDEESPRIGADMLPFLTIRDSRAPVIAAVNGICQAGGLLIAMLADICVASDRATFRVPELLRGIPDATYAAVLPAHVGIAVARDLLLSARRFDAAEAQRLGVISRVVPHEELRAAALTAAKEVLMTPPMTRMLVKRMLNERYGFVDYQTMFWALEESPEPREGMRAFMEKRSPAWVPAEFAKGNGRL